MKQIKFRLDDDEYELAKVNAAVCGVNSVNVFAKRKVLEVETTPLSIHVSDKPAKAVFTYLYPHEIEILKRNAAWHEYES